jgi:NTE family protein
MTRALVLSGGGPVGTAWEAGLVAGFAEAGVSLGAADLILGTSAGAIVGARLAAGAPPAELADMFANPGAGAEPPARVTRGAPIEAFAQMTALVEETQRGARNPADVRRELGALALACRTMDEERYLAWIGRMLPQAAHLGWPSERFACTGVDAGDGAFQLWDAGSGVDLLPAVAASCAFPGAFPPVTVQGRRYMDGGVRSFSNADLAAGHDLIVLVFVETPAQPAWAAERVMEEVELLKAADATVVVITPEEGAAEIVADLMDATRQPAAARAGRLQGLAQAEILKGIWG